MNENHIYLEKYLEIQTRVSVFWQGIELRT